MIIMKNPTSYIFIARETVIDGDKDWLAVSVEHHCVHAVLLIVLALRMEYLLEELGSEMRDHTQGREEVAGAHSSLQDIGCPDVTFEDIVFALIGPLGILLVFNSHPFRRGFTFNPADCFLLSELFVHEHLRISILCHQPVALLFQEELILGQVFHLDARSFRTLGNKLLLLLLLHPS
jgi:hypothetical protein